MSAFVLNSIVIEYAPTRRKTNEDNRKYPDTNNECSFF